MPEHRTPPEPEPGRERLRSAVVRPSGRQVVVAALLAVLGFAFVVQVRDTAANDTYAGLRESELVEVLDGLTGTAERARREVDRLEARRDELTDENQARFAALIVYLGDQLGVGGQLSTGVIVVLGIRIFSNVAAIRRHLFHA